MEGRVIEPDICLAGYSVESLVACIEMTTPLISEIDHICLAVRRIDAARGMLEKFLGYAPKTEVVENTRQKVNVQFLQRYGQLDIKLIEPSDIDSPLVEFIKRTGGGLHHIALKTDNVTEAVNDLEKGGAQIVTRPEPGEAFDGCLIAFAYLGHGLNVELIDTELRRSLIAP